MIIFFYYQINENHRTMKKIKAAIIGYGNIGRYVLEALQTAPDFEITGVVRRDSKAAKPVELMPYKVVENISELERPDVAILAVPSRKTEEYATEILKQGICTVDSFDIHSLIPETRARLSAVLPFCGCGSARCGRIKLIPAGILPWQSTPFALSGKSVPDSPREPLHNAAGSGRENSAVLSHSFVFPAAFPWHNGWIQH